MKTSELIDAVAAAPFQEFLFAHENEDEERLVLRQKDVAGVPAGMAAQQVKGRRKAKHKLPSWYKTKGIVYPPSLNLEQCSSEDTARFKSSILEKHKSQRIVDLTGGFGVDTLAFAGSNKAVTYVEPNNGLLATVRHNHQALGATTISYVGTTAEDFLAQSASPVDAIYIDPSRRSNGQKVFRLGDCEPNVVSLQPQLFSRSRLHLVKASPLLDIQQGLRELLSVKEVYVVAVSNECKELLFLCEAGFAGEPTITCVDLSSADGNGFSFHWSEEQRSVAEQGSLARYLFEPNAAILKAGAFKLVGSRSGVAKLDQHTHLYSSDTFVDSFPGRVFEVLEKVKPDKALAKTFLQGRTNVLLRNYPSTVSDLLKKTGLTEGGELYLIGCSVGKEKLLLKARRLQ